MKKAIITGITGQDGSHLADFLIEKGYKVVGVSRRTADDSKYRISHLLKNPAFTYEEADITDNACLFFLFEKHRDVEELYNFAAQSHVGTSFKSPGTTWDITGKGVLNILQALVDLKMTHVKFYQASSSEMFGKNYDTKGSFKYQDENTKFLPQSPYAIAKCAAHYMTRLYREAYGLHASCGILFNHEGERRGEQFVTRKITKWIAAFNESGKDPAFPKLRLGNLDAFRDWGYAKDYVKAAWLMLQKDEPGDYVVCTEETHTVREFLDAAFACIGVDDWSDLVVIDPEFYRPAEVDYLRGDATKARHELGWNNETSFEDLVKKMVTHDVEQERLQRQRVQTCKTACSKKRQKTLPDA